MVLGIDDKEPPGTVRAFVDAKRLTYPSFQDPKEEAYSRFASRYVPWNVVLSVDRKVLYSEAGFHPGAVRGVVDQALKDVKK